MLKKIIQLKLKIAARMVISKYHPEIIGITGSVGKTSTKEAVAAVLSKKFKVRKSEKNYNNEIGLPLTIIGSTSPGKNIFGWFLISLKVLRLLLFKDRNYPQVLVLEMGIDRIGDMDYLNSIVKCKIGVVTFIGPNHLEYFGSIDKIQKEKGKLIENLQKDGWAIFNFDNERARNISKVSKSKILTFGLKEGADIRAREVTFSFEGEKDFSNPKGISFKLSHKGSFAPVLLPHVIGYNSVYAALAGAAVGVSMGMNLVEISESLREFSSPRGRMNLIEGIKNTLIVDDTYNASSPDPVISAIDILKKIPIEPNCKRFAVLGDMLELGRESERGHRKVGKYVYECNLDILIVVGERSRDIARGAREAGMKEENIFHFPVAEEAGLFVQNRINKGDLILVKGSQGVRMEKIVKEIMADPLRAGELLVRQGKEWGV